MAYKPCENCKGTGKIGSAICTTCSGSGLVRKPFTCPVCNGRYYLPRDPPVRVRCPYCNSLLWTETTFIRVLERGVAPIPPPGSKAPLGAIGGGLLGLALGGPAGAVLLGLIGLAAGAIAEAPLKAREE